MRKMTMGRIGLLAVLAVATSSMASPLQAQRGARIRGQGPNMGRSLELVLEHREKLELTDQQLRELEELKTIVDSDVTPLVEEIRSLREQIRQGEVDWNDGARQLQALAGQVMTASAPLRGRVQEILTVQQHRTLRREMWANRPGRGLRGPALQGRTGRFRDAGGAFQGRIGGRTPRGQLRGSRGGLGIRQGFTGGGGIPSPGFQGGFSRGVRPFRGWSGRGWPTGGGDSPVFEGAPVPGA